MTRDVSESELRSAERLGELAWRERKPRLFERWLDDGRVLQLLKWRAHGVQLSIGRGDGFYTDTWIYDCEQAEAGWRAALGWDGQGEPDGWFRHPQSGRRRPDGDPSKEFVRP